MENETLLGWVLTGVGAIVATLSAAVATLWKTSESNNAKAIAALQKESEECHRQKIEFIKKVSVLEGRIAELEKKIKELNHGHLPGGDQ